MNQLTVRPLRAILAAVLATGVSAGLAAAEDHKPATAGVALANRPAEVEPAKPAAHPAPAAPTTPDAALAALLEGNKRYRDGHAAHPHQDPARRAELARTQHPAIVIVACADSRVAPELVFDAGLGDVFVCRVAGNIADDAVIGSVEYAAEHLGSCLVVVMGHERCGAVTAAVDLAAKNAEAPGHIAQLVGPIKPAVAEARKAGTDNLVERAIDENVALAVRTLRASKPILGHLVEQGKLKVVGGRYDLDTGEFTLIDRPEPPTAAAAGAELVKPATHH